MLSHSNKQNTVFTFFRNQPSNDLL